ncbi:MAG TPA: maleylpyruvate isomerase N-terminal domain-containing protein [Mycobacteriales bacterium]|nr:maleylpyruvate isomerase N-terminal domain-containing protein [Mycobacteriales bacterium]
MHVSHDDARDAFLGALSRLAEVAGGLDDDALLTPSRCLGWTTGDVLVHVHLGLQEMLLGVVSPTGAEPDTDAAGYWRVPAPVTDAGPDEGADADADRLAGAQFVRRLGAAYRRPSGVVGHLRPTVDGLATAVGAMPAGAVRFQGRVLATGDFLATWAVELAVHHLDLAPGRTLPPPAAPALALGRATVEALLGAALPAAWDDRTVLLVGTGRAAPDERQAAEAGPVAARLPVLG